MSALSLKRQKFSQESTTESRLISPVQFLRYPELGIRWTNERSVRQSIDIRESVDAWPRRLRRHKLYNGLLKKLYNDNWPFAMPCKICREEK